jgi:hypothetical protein
VKCSAGAISSPNASWKAEARRYLSQLRHRFRIAGEEEYEMKLALAIISILCCVGSALPVAAQAELEAFPESTANDAWFHVTELTAGKSVRVVLDNATSYQGAFRMADDQSITLEVSGRNQRVSRARVRRISVARGTHRRRNVLLGLAIGGGAGAMAVALQCLGKAPACKEVAPAYVDPGLGVGTGIGALLPGRDWQEIYPSNVSS